jgi:gliding motility-associated-like protein
LDGIPVNTFSIVSGNPIYSYARISITSGNHRIISPHKFTASVYGFGNYESYGYAAGFSLDNLQYSFTAGPDYACPGEPVIFFVQNYPNIVSIKWLFGDGTIAYGQNVAHYYALGNNYNVGLELTDNTGCTKDTIWKIIHITPAFQTNLNPSICQGDSFAVGNHYYNATGLYKDTLIRISNGCDSIITTNLTVNTKKQTTLNSTICQGKTLAVGNHNYSLAGNYIDTLSTIGGCDSIVYTHLAVNPLSQYAQSANLCQGDILKVGNHIYASSGYYQDTLSNYLGCDSIIKTNLIVTPYPFIDLGKDREICEDNTIDLQISNNYTSYLWQDGSTNNSFLVSKPGKYWVTVANDYCIKSDTVYFKLCKKPINVWIPNAFTPNGDGLNDYFKVESSGEFAGFNLAIYNRWGNLVFESNNPMVIWDGKSNGNDAEAGIYTYILTYSGKDIKQKKQLKGRLSIIR